jgi:hypothetical protein
LRAHFGNQSKSEGESERGHSVRSEFAAFSSPGNQTLADLHGFFISPVYIDALFYSFRMYFDKSFMFLPYPYYYYYSFFYFLLLTVLFFSLARPHLSQRTHVRQS